MTALSYITARIYAGGLGGASRTLRHGPEKFVQEVLPAMGRLLSPSVNPVYTICVWVIIAVGVFYPVYKRRWEILPLLVSFIITVLAMTFTTSEATSRYGIYLFFAAAGGYGLFLQKMQDEMEDSRIRRRIYPAAIGVVVLCAVLSMIYNYRNLIKNDTSSQSTYAQVATEMRSRGVTKGYATFDWASTITVVSNDAVQVRPVNNMKDLEGSKWLANETWYPPYADADVPVVYVTTDYTKEDFLETAKERGMKIADKKTLGDYILFYTDRDKTVWRD